MTPPGLTRVALASLVGLALASLAFVFTEPSRPGANVPPGLVLACAKVIVLAIVFQRVRRANVYGMQWSSMLILLFVAEAAVRATSDPQPSATIGWIEGLFALSCFGALLGILRPMKKAARHSTPPRAREKA